MGIGLRYCLELREHGYVRDCYSGRPRSYQAAFTSSRGNTSSAMRPLHSFVPCFSFIPRPLAAIYSCISLAQLPAYQYALQHPDSVGILYW